MSNRPKTREELILITVDDLVYKLLWDDRKEDEELPRGEIEEAIEADEVTIHGIIKRFARELRNKLEEEPESDLPVKTFRFVADCDFEAVDIIDAMSKVAEHFQTLVDGGDSKIIQGGKLVVKLVLNSN